MYPLWIVAQRLETGHQLLLVLPFYFRTQLPAMQARDQHQREGKSLLGRQGTRGDCEGSRRIGGLRGQSPDFLQELLEQVRPTPTERLVPFR